MAKLGKDLEVATLHPRENLYVTGALASTNAEIITNCDGGGTVIIDIRGTFSATLEVSGTVDNTNWVPIPMRPVNQAAKLYVATIVGAVAGVWIGSCNGYRKVRLRDTAHTSGSVTAYISATNIAVDQSLDGMITTSWLTITAAAAAGATLTIPAPGVGLRQYLTFLRISRFASATLVAAATPVLITTTNFPAAMTFSIPADASLIGTVYTIQEDFAYPIACAAQNTATTVVAPATTTTIWRLTAGWYVAP